MSKNALNFLVLFFVVLIIAANHLIRNSYFTFLFFYFASVVLVSYQIGGLTSYIVAIIASTSRFIGINPVYIKDDVGLQGFLESGWLLISILGVYLSVAYIINKQKQYFEKLKQYALTDDLTNIPNRRCFLNCLTSFLSYADRRKKPFALAFVDIDKFKEVNDTKGHAQGDELLKLVSKTMRAHLREEDKCARLGGDEFGILLAHPANEERTILRLKESLDTAVKYSKFDVTFSIGVVRYTGTKKATSKRLLSFADKLMYRVKHAGKNDIKHKIL